MIAQIQFIQGINELTLPIIKLTKSKNGKTGTATFVFIYPDIFKQITYQTKPINGMYLLSDYKEIMTNDIIILFKEGKPFLIKTIFIFKNSNEWFNFLNFMSCYSKETGLFFAETNSYF